jgi:hypothetical protein
MQADNQASRADLKTGLGEHAPGMLGISVGIAIGITAKPMFHTSFSVSAMAFASPSAGSSVVGHLVNANHSTIVLGNTGRPGGGPPAVARHGGRHDVCTPPGR